MLVTLLPAGRPASPGADDVWASIRAHEAGSLAAEAVSTSCAGVTCCCHLACAASCARLLEQLASMEEQDRQAQQKAKSRDGMSRINLRNKTHNFQMALTNATNRPEGEKVGKCTEFHPILRCPASIMCSSSHSLGQALLGTTGILHAAAMWQMPRCSIPIPAGADIAHRQGIAALRARGIPCQYNHHQGSTTIILYASITADILLVMPAGPHSGPLLAPRHAPQHLLEHQGRCSSQALCIRAGGCGCSGSARSTGGGP